ncbi:hypothetical protein DFQ30_000449 [Apophysomyces sp. BC1015]|nr:hypothetical protein DFQ30_000449 [Apophysomyces sp. BC1015]KAG0178088.1 hypothetical protein DFQ29_003966 [Apophysomyces sp. BC1021]
MPHSTGDRQISVFETTLYFQKDVLSVFNIVIQSSTNTVSLVRYPFDLIEFHQKIKFYYPRSKICFPTLGSPANNLHLSKRRSLRNLLMFNKKSNADKVEQYLRRCFQHPVVSVCSILRDFLSVQRDEDTCFTPRPSFDNIPSSVKPTDQKSPAASQHSILATPPPAVSLDDFELLKVLGKGCMGKVLLVRSTRDRQLYALKAIKKDWVIQKNEVMHTRAERDILARLRDQPFLIKLHYAFQTPLQLYLVLDYHGGGDIATQMSICTTFSEERTRFYAAEILHGLSVLHSHGIIYRDLKPENILIGRDGHIVLTDFGLSKVFTVGENDVTHTFCGTAEYLAPEVFLGEPYTYAVDYWSFGTLLYEMLAGITPFWADKHVDMFQRVLEDPLEFPSHFEPITCDFLSGLLEREAYERLGWSGADQIKTHCYFKDINWTDVAERRLQPPYIPILESDTDMSNFDDVFVNMSPRISQTSSNELLLDDPFDQFTFDSRIEPSCKDDTITPTKTLRKKSQPQKRGKERFSSSSSLLSLGVGDVVRHTDTLPTILSSDFSQQQSSLHHRQLSLRTAYIRKRHSAALSLSLDIKHNVPFEEQGSWRKSKRRQIAAVNSNGEASSSTHALTKITYSPAASMHCSSSIYSKSSLTFSSAHAAESMTRAGSELSDSGAGRPPKPESPYERPHCPVPGQVRPPIALSDPDPAATTRNSMYSNLSYDAESMQLQSCAPSTISPSETNVQRSPCCS